MDHRNHERLHADELKMSVLEGAAIFGADDARIGRVAYMHGAGTPSLVVIDVVGMDGSPPKRIAIPMSQLVFERDENGDVHARTSWNPDQIRKMPEHKDI